jgi:hypothetical protein
MNQGANTFTNPGSRGHSQPPGLRAAYSLSGFGRSGGGACSARLSPPYAAFVVVQSKGFAGPVLILRGERLQRRPHPSVMARSFVQKPLRRTEVIPSRNHLSSPFPVINQ